MERLVMTEDVLKYKNQWVALSGDLQRVVGHGSTAKIAADQARADHEKHAILVFIPERQVDLLVV